MRRALLILAVLASTAALAADKRPLVPLMSAAEVTRNCDEGLAKVRKTMGAMEAKPGAGAIFDEWNRLQIELENFYNPIYLLGSVDTDKAVRDASEPCLQKITAFSTELFQSEKLFRRVQAARAANPRQAKLRKDLMEGFEDSGVALPPDKRKRAKEIFDRIEELRQEFDKAIREDPTKVAFTRAEMEGLPESYLKAQEKKKDASGNYVLGLDYPSYFPFVQNARSAEARKKYYIAKAREGGEKNLERLFEIYKLRKELAGLYGLPSYAHYAMRRKMVESPERAGKFLEDVRAAVADLEKKEVDELRAEKAKDLGTPPGETKIERWDVGYYQERVKRARYRIDQEKLREYFPTDKSVDFALAVSQRLYNVKFREAKVKTWHEDVRYFDVFDERGRFLSGFYLDLYPREGKYNHAAAFPIRGASTRAGRTALSALVANFNREGLNHDELETLMHEFGHVLHGVLSRTEYNPHAGTSVKQDFVEAPSQMFEEWARREQPLGLFRQICPKCPQLGRDDIERLENARRYGQGIRYARQWLLARLDLELSLDPQPPLVVWTRLEEASPLGHVKESLFPASFGHLAAQYGAGYYGYMWSEVIALDMLSKFKANMLDAKVGRAYRDAILSQGGQIEEMRMVRKFLGREPSSEAFFAEITGKR
jgi:thimet oligopeptidase